MRQAVLVGAIATLALGIGFGLSIRLDQPFDAAPSAARTLLSTPLPDLQNRPQNLAQYRGKVLIVNFWATWCPPCREEIPLFVQTQAELASQGVQFVGIALDERQQVAAFVLEHAVNYPVLIGGLPESEALRQLGNPGGGLPYTLIYDRAGILRERILGGLDRRRLHQALASQL